MQKREWICRCCFLVEASRKSECAYKWKVDERRLYCCRIIHWLLIVRWFAPVCCTFTVNYTLVLVGKENQCQAEWTCGSSSRWIDYNMTSCGRHTHEYVYAVRRERIVLVSFYLLLFTFAGLLLCFIIFFFQVGDVHFHHSNINTVL